MPPASVSACSMRSVRSAGEAARRRSSSSAVTRWSYKMSFRRPGYMSDRGERPALSSKLLRFFSRPSSSSARASPWLASHAPTPRIPGFGGGSRRVSSVTPSRSPASSVSASCAALRNSSKTP